MHRIYYPYETFRADLKALTSKIDKPFDAIVGIARGGMLIAQMLGEYYNLRAVFCLNALAYDDTRKRDAVRLYNLPDLSTYRSVLVVDDIVDSGDTMKEVLSTLQARFADIGFESAALFYKQSASFVPTWYVKEPEGWIDFFWSVDLKV